jgi:SH3 domain-containing YSC84-like protein 1
MRRLIGSMSLCAVLLAAGFAWGAENDKDTGKKTGNKQEARLVAANEVFHEMMNAPDKGIPQDLIAKAHCIAIIPDTKKVAIFALGGEHGAGVVTCRKNNGTGPWGPPSAFTLSGGSFGLQLGYSDTDYVLLFMTDQGMKKLLEDKFTVGADLAGAAGPVGRTASAATDAQLHAQILTYSRSKGLFAGVSLKGAVLQPNHDDNTALYGREVSSKELLLQGDIAPPPAASELLSTLNRFSSSEEKQVSAVRDTDR